VPLGENSVAGLEDEIIAWQDERIAARDRPPEPEPAEAA
jgi:predicted DNA-binding transcriptional regulator AlpA